MEGILLLLLALTLQDNLFVARKKNIQHVIVEGD